ncbi:hypothetical protein GGI25_003042 [Coemansia spiralis]|uniref:Uncharacterized protein n=2 Tax=Coemansia TaxID=4863 RepID=A0A9W8G9G2_9FUNG|nr:hypothetical protein EDC05_002961 [Coemansia umbellata]KAJ2677652.1 hypothetical protein GGI25_003042 [Coemansia spiralis]
MESMWYSVQLALELFFGPMSEHQNPVYDMPTLVTKRNSGEHNSNTHGDVITGIVILVCVSVALLCAGGYVWYKRFGKKRVAGKADNDLL